MRALVCKVAGSIGKAELGAIAHVVTNLRSGWQFDFVLAIPVIFHQLHMLREFPIRAKCA